MACDYRKDGVKKVLFKKGFEYVGISKLIVKCKKGKSFIFASLP